MAIKKVAVFGAGVMGSGIAAQLANAGIEVELLDRLPSSADVAAKRITQEELNDRDIIAKKAGERMLKTSPAPLMHKRNIKRIRPGNVDDHVDRIKDCDLIIEVVFEDPKVKHDTFKKIDAHRKPGSIVASNTSTIPLKDLVSGQTDQFKKDFVITHFFNPPRYMPLCELVTSENNSKEMVAELTRFLDEKMGKGVIPCNDTPGFIGNRIGTYWIQTAINEAHDKKLTIEEADAIVGRPMGVPKTGVFGLVDLVGLDLMPYISKSLVAKLPADDGYVKGNKSYPIIDDMIKNGYTGRKGKGGFYRVGEKKADGERDKLSVDLATGKERPTIKVVAKGAAPEKGNFPPKAIYAAASAEQKKLLDALIGEEKARLKKEKESTVELDTLAVSKKRGLKGLVEAQDKYGQYAWAVLKKTICYAAEHAHDITTDITKVDGAMKLGYNWKYGPFELADKLGADYIVKRLEKEGEKVPALLKTAAGKKFYKTIGGKLNFLQKDGSYAEVKRPEGVLLLSDIKRAKKPLKDNTHNISIPGVGKLELGARLWDIGDGVLCLEFASKMNALDSFSLKMIETACDTIEKSLKKGDGKYKALVIHNEGEDFSVGANIGLALKFMKAGQYWLVDKLVTQGQAAMKRIKYAPFPVVAAPSGKAFGGGCEVLMHSSHVQAHAETYPGLVEVGVGLLPAWGGTTELLSRAKQNKKLPGGPIPAVATAFDTLANGKVAFSAQEAKDLMIFRETDGVTMNKSRLLFDAKQKALEMAKDFKPEQPFDLKDLPGPSGLAAVSLQIDGLYLKGAITPYDVVVNDKLGKVMTGDSCAGPGVLLTQDHIRKFEHERFMELARDPRTLFRIERTLGGKGRKEYMKIEMAAGQGDPARRLREKADADAAGAGLFNRVFKGKSAKKSFDKACNDNKKCKNVKKDTKAQVNWPSPRKKK